MPTDDSPRPDPYVRQLTVQLRIARADAEARSLLLDAALRRCDDAAIEDGRLRWILRSAHRADLTREQTRSHALTAGYPFRATRE